MGKFVEFYDGDGADLKCGWINSSNISLIIVSECYKNNLGSNSMVVFVVTGYLSNQKCNLSPPLSTKQEAIDYMQNIINRIN